MTAVAAVFGPDILCQETVHMVLGALEERRRRRRVFGFGIHGGARGRGRVFCRLWFLSIHRAKGRGRGRGWEGRDKPQWRGLCDRPRWEVLCFVGAVLLVVVVARKVGQFGEVSVLLSMKERSVERGG